MKPRAWFFAAALVLGAVELVSACSEKVPLASIGGKCEYDQQCSEGLFCKCVRRRNPDDEGPDEILAPGTCQKQDYSCSTDAGPVDSAPLDTGAALDSGVPDSASSADAADAD